MQHIALPAGKTEWSREWPKTEGVFWFYGFPWGADRKTFGVDQKPDLLCVLVRRVSNGFLYVAEGFTICHYGAEAAVGFWTPAILPSKPNAKQIPVTARKLCKHDYYDDACPHCAQENAKDKK